MQKWNAKTRAKIFILAAMNFLKPEAREYHVAYGRKYTNETNSLPDLKLFPFLVLVLLCFKCQFVVNLHIQTVTVRSNSTSLRISFKMSSDNNNNLITFFPASFNPSASSVLGQSSCRRPQLQLYAHFVASLPKPPVLPSWLHPGIHKN